MRFAIIEPAKVSWEMVDAKEPRDLYPQLGLGDVDHGTLVMPRDLPSGVGIAIVVDGFGLFQPPDKQRYFAIGRKLFAGNAVLYGFDEGGETVDLQEMPVVVFLSPSGIEGAIALDQIDRPACTANGDKFWEWPGESPAWMKRS